MDEQAREIRDAYDRVFSDESIVLILFVSAMLLSPVLQFEALNPSNKIKPQLLKFSILYRVNFSTGTDASFAFRHYCFKGIPDKPHPAALVMQSWHRP